MAEFFFYNRTNAAEDYDSFERAYKGAGGYMSLSGTVPASAAALPQLAGAVVQQYVSADRFATTVVCSGTVKKFGDTWGVLINDTVASGTAEYAISGKFSLRLDAALTPAAGDDAYMIVASGLVTTAAGAGKDYIGKFISAKTTDPTARPTGDYAEVELMQTEL